MRFFYIKCMHMSTEQIAGYVLAERARGVTDEAIKDALLQKGWKAEDVALAMGLPAGAISSGVSAHQGMWSGRLDKRGFIMITLLGIAIMVAGFFMALSIGYNMDEFNGTDVASEGASFIVGIIIGLVILLTLAFVSLGATVRRLHDIGQSGWWVCIGFIPYLGNFLSLALTIYLCIKDSVPTSNQWGDVPKSLSLWQSIRGLE